LQTRDFCANADDLKKNRLGPIMMMIFLWYDHVEICPRETKLRMPDACRHNPVREGSLMKDSRKNIQSKRRTFGSLYMNGHLSLPVPDVVERAGVFSELVLDLVREH